MLLEFAYCPVRSVVTDALDRAFARLQLNSTWHKNLPHCEDFQQFY